MDEFVDALEPGDEFARPDGSAPERGPDGIITREEANRRLGLALEAAGYTITSASAKLGWHRGRLWAYVRGGKVPGWVIVAYLVEKLDLDLRVLFPEAFAGARKKGKPPDPA